MKRTALLHAELSQVIATLGHVDMLVIGDAGLPIPAGPRHIDLAITPGVASLADVLTAVLTEMQVEHAFIATQAMSAGNASLPEWCRDRLPVVPQTIPHEELKRISAQAKAIVRTGECTPYANIILCAGVTF